MMSVTKKEHGNMLISTQRQHLRQLLRLLFPPITCLHRQQVRDAVQISQAGSNRSSYFFVQIYAVM